MKHEEFSTNLQTPDPDNPFREPDDPVPNPFPNPTPDPNPAPIPDPIPGPNPAPEPFPRPPEPIPAYPPEVIF